MELLRHLWRVIRVGHLGEIVCAHRSLLLPLFAQERRDAGDERFRLLQVAIIAGGWNELELGPRDGLLEGATIVRAHDAIAFSPEHQGWDGDAMQPPAQDGIMHERFPGKARGRLT